jgi:membrane protease YdiL (CAAX protease family)
MAIKTFIERRPVFTYFALAYAIAWGGILLVVGPTGIPGSGEELERLRPLVFLAMIAGPSILGITLTAIVDGRKGLRRFFFRLTRWRVGARWYGALFISPLLAAAVLFALSLVSPDFVPGIVTRDDKTSLLVFGLVGGLGAGCFEEIGWTGFAVPKVRLRHGVLATGLIVGLSWGAWHYMADLWGEAGDYGALFLPHFLLFWGVALTAYRVLMVWAYDHTGSLLLAQLMHASFTGGLIILGPSGASTAQSLLWNALFAVALWAVVGMVAVAGGSRFVRRPLQKRVT